MKEEDMALNKFEWNKKNSQTVKQEELTNQSLDGWNKALVVMVLIWKYDVVDMFSGTQLPIESQL